MKCTPRQRVRAVNNRGFTIVELLVVIVIIGILAAITIVAFNGVTRRAEVAVLRSDLTNAAKRMFLDQIEQGAFPALVSAANGGEGLAASSGVTYQLTVDNMASPQTFCLTATLKSTSYTMNSTSMEPVEGACPGHSIGGVVTPTFANLTLVNQPELASYVFNAVATSDSGDRVVAVSNTYIMTSVDYGETWVQNAAAGSRVWKDVAVSSDGMKIIAAANNSSLYRSTDFGSTWTVLTNAGTGAWSGVASSADGTKYYAVTSGASTGLGYSSFDSGDTWTLTHPLTRNFQSVDMSADGTVIVLAPSGGLNIRFSNDSGTTWANRSYATNYREIECSATCSEWIMGTANTNLITSSNFASTNAILFSGLSFFGTAISGDGTKLVAARTNSGEIRTSTDSGVTWVNRASLGTIIAWNDVATSYDGSRLYVAGVNGFYSGSYD